LAVIGSDVGDTIALVDVTDPEQGTVKEVLWKQGRGLDVRPDTPVYSPVTRRCVFVGRQQGKGMALYSLAQGQPDPPRRRESGGFDGLTRDRAFSPDGRYIVFASDRIDRRPRRIPSVDAPALSGITVDGDLKDWPAAMERHAIRNLQAFPPRNGPGGLEHAF